MMMIIKRDLPLKIKSKDLQIRSNKNDVWTCIYETLSNIFIYPSHCLICFYHQFCYLKM
jgi:hypothetical protein